MADGLDIHRRRLADQELERLKTHGSLQTLGGFTLASLVASLNQAGIGPEDVEVLGNGNSYGITLDLRLADEADLDEAG